MSIYGQALEKEYNWLLGEIQTSLSADVVAEGLEPLSKEDLDRVAADKAFLLSARLLNALLVDKVAGLAQLYAEEQRVRRDLSVAGVRHKELARSLMTLKLRRFNHIGRTLKLENELSPKLQGDKK